MDLTGELLLVVTTDLVVRSRPGTGPDSEIYLGRLNAPDMVYVIAGPERANGYDWYLVDPVREPCYLGCDFEPQPGWVAAAGKDGERWLGQEPERPDCPAAPTTDDLLAMLAELRLYCYGGQELTLDGYITGMSSEAPPEWPWEWFNGLYESDYSPITGCQDACDPPSLRLVHDSDIGVPYLPGATRISGQFDDPLAERCEPIGSNGDPRLGIHECRLLFVVTSGWGGITANGARTQAWTTARGIQPLGWQVSGLYRFGELWIGLAEGPAFDDYTSGSGQYAEQALRRLSDRLRERRGPAYG